MDIIVAAVDGAATIATVVGHVHTIVNGLVNGLDHITKGTVQENLSLRSIYYLMPENEPS